MTHLTSMLRYSHPMCTEFDIDLWNAPFEDPLNKQLDFTRYLFNPNDHPANLSDHSYSPTDSAQAIEPSASEPILPSEEKRPDWLNQLADMPPIEALLNSAQHQSILLTTQNLEALEPLTCPGCAIPQSATWAKELLANEVNLQHPLCKKCYAHWAYIKVKAKKTTTGNSKQITTKICKTCERSFEKKESLKPQNRIRQNTDLCRSCTDRIYKKKLKAADGSQPKRSYTRVFDAEVKAALTVLQQNTTDSKSIN